MTEQEKKSRILELYAKLGELSLVRKQTLQQLEAVDKEITLFETEVIKVLQTTPATKELKSEKA